MSTNHGMYIKRDNVRIKRIILDLRDIIAVISFLEVKGLNANYDLTLQ